MEQNLHVHGPRLSLSPPLLSVTRLSQRSLVFTLTWRTVLSLASLLFRSVVSVPPNMLPFPGRTGLWMFLVYWVSGKPHEVDSGVSSSLYGTLLYEADKAS